MKGSTPRIEALPAVDRAAEVERAIVNYVVNSGFSPGDRLPAERNFMEALGVGRSTIREALRKLQSSGVLETRQGSGTFLVRKTSPNAVHVPLLIDVPDLKSGLLKTLDIRRALEAEAGALAAQRRTAADLTLIEARLLEMERVHLSLGSANSEDLEFHLAIYAAAQNPLFSQLLEQMREAFQRFWRRPFDRPDFAARSFPFHRKLFETIRDRQPEAARSLTLKILSIVEEDIREMVK